MVRTGGNMECISSEIYHGNSDRIVTVSQGFSLGKWAVLWKIINSPQFHVDVYGLYQNLKVNNGQIHHRYGDSAPFLVSSVSCTCRIGVMDDGSKCKIR